eukprot:g67653.t1
MLAAMLAVEKAPLAPSSELPEAAKQFLQKSTLGDVLKRTAARELVTIKADSTVEAALLLMQKERINSVPVLDKSAKIIGVLNMLDLSTAISFAPCFKKYKDEPLKLQTIESAEFHATLNTDIMLQAVEELLGTSSEGTRPVWEYKEEDSLLVALQVFGSRQHRITVRLADGKLRNLSQSDVLQFLRGRLEVFGGLAGESVGKLGLVKEHKVVTVDQHESALCGYRKAYNDGWEVSALPVVDGAGQIVATLSKSDLRGLGPTGMGRLLLPVKEFLAIAPASPSQGQIRPTLACRPSSTLKELILKLAFGRVHRIWMCENNKTMGVVSLTDIMSKLHLLATEDRSHVDSEAEKIVVSEM